MGAWRDPNQLVRDHHHQWRKGKKMKEAWRDPNQLVRDHHHLWRKERKVKEAWRDPNQLVKDHHLWRKEGEDEGSMEGPKPTGEGPPPPMEEREDGEGSMEDVGMLGPYITSGEEPSSRFLW